MAHQIVLLVCVIIGFSWFLLKESNSKENKKH